MMEWIKAHKILAVVLGLVGFYFIYRLVAGSGGGGTTTVAGPSDATTQAELALQAQEQQTTAQSNLATQQLQAGLLNAQIGAAVSDNQTNAQAAAYQANLAAGTSASEDTNQTAIALANAQLSNQLQLQTGNNAAALQALGIQTTSNQEMTSAQIAGALQSQNLNNQAAGAQNSVAEYIANLGAGVTNQQNQEQYNAETQYLSNQNTQFNESNATNERLGTLALNQNNAQVIGAQNIQSQGNQLTASQFGEYLQYLTQSANNSYNLSEQGIQAGESGQFGPNNSASLIAAGIGQPGVGQSIIGGGVAGAQSGNAFLSNFFSSLFGGASKSASSYFG